MKNRFIFAFLLSLILATAYVIAGEGDKAMAERIKLQLKSPGRDQYDAIKDPSRKPLEVAQFYGLQAGMTVLDMTTGGGYNTEIFSAAVGASGIVYAHNYHYVLQLIDGAHHKTMLNRLQNDRLPNVRYMVVDAEDMPFENSIDMAYWGFNMHDIYNSEKPGDGEPGVQTFLQGIYKALKPGGTLGVSDHVGEAAYDNVKFHRIEPRIIKQMIEKAGFTIEATSDLLANPADDHSQSIYTDGLRYNTDRILIKASKPK
ncbi:MAG: class I SAM-dependent methyltransferase [Cycloclasticus sp.]|nr:class I SAM-dependent methyltransferase [Cycloclasticus sp.]MBQ0789780.1 class I SAM-dependent methyltransferase [Cycloclasticus sp.]